MKVGFIGAGNMASAIIKGICSKKLIEADCILASNPSSGKLEALKRECGIEVTNDNKEAAKVSDILFLCVKPQKMDDVIDEIKEIVSNDTLLVSIAAGKTLDYFKEAFGKEIKMVRVMPNAPSQTGDGISAVTPNALAKEDENLNMVLDLMKSVGEVVIVEEPMIDIAGQIAGASPAWIAMVIEAMADGAVLEGMPREMAYKFASAGVYGAGLMSYKLGGNPGKIKDMVTSPKGTTIEGVKILEERGVRAAFMDAVISSCEKSKKL